MHPVMRDQILMAAGTTAGALLAIAALLLARRKMSKRAT